MDGLPILSITTFIPLIGALMILGFLGVGTAMRRRRITPELARYNSPEQAPGRPDWRKLPVE